MSIDLLLRNLLAYALQIAVLILIGSMVPYAFRLRLASARLAYWHLLLVVCVALPLLEHQRPSPMDPGAQISATSVPLGIVGDRRPRSISLPSWQVSIAILLATGTLIRLGWLLAGCWRLRLYRMRARPYTDLPVHIRDLRDWWSPRACFYVSDEVNGPVTFGVRKPAVLVPGSFLEMDERSQQAIACHELLHLSRHDWLFTIAEEIIRCAFWFHPAIWWLLGRIQLTREQAVDRAVVDYTTSPDHYLSALLAIARRGLEPDLEPAPLFLKKRHLKQRVASLLNGGTMSRQRLIMAMLGSFAVLPVLVGVAMWQFPLMAAPQSRPADDNGVDVNTGAYKLLHRTGVAYPFDLQQQGVSGQVVANVTVNDTGEVTDAKIISGPDALRRTVLQSVFGWHFAVESVPASHNFDVSVNFTAPPIVGRRPVTAALVPALPSTQNKIISSIDVSMLPAALQERVSALNTIHDGDTVSSQQINEYEAAVKKIDSHLNVGLVAIEPGKIALRVSLPGMIARPAAPALSFDPATPTPPQRIRVGGNVQAMNIVQKVMPVYPQVAKQAHVQGVVKFQAIIGKDGQIENLELLSGHPLLAPAATEAVRQWVYKPTLLNGNPVEVITQIDVNFTLADGPPPQQNQ